MFDTRFFTKCLGTAAFVSVIAFTSCKEDRNGWGIAGNIAGAADSTLFIEEPSGAAWIIVDSLKVGDDGNFDFVAVRPSVGGQNIYRLRINDRAIYFPIENAERLSVSANYDDMDMVHKLSGSAAADGFNAVDSVIAAAVSDMGAGDAVNSPELVRELGNIILGDTTCIVSYYALNRPVDNKYIFTADNRQKVGLIGAAATRYKTLRPDDRRGKELEIMFTKSKEHLNGGKTKGVSVAATQIGRPDVDLVRKDVRGNEFSLKKQLDNGKPTVVSLIRYADAAAPAFTAKLGELFEKYGRNGLEIFQISFDPNVAVWRQTAATMPWTSVHSAPDESVEFLVAYNVNPVDGGPICLIFNREGELIERVTNPADLDKAVASVL